MFEVQIVEVKRRRGVRGRSDVHDPAWSLPHQVQRALGERDRCQVVGLQGDLVAVPAHGSGARAGASGVVDQEVQVVGQLVHLGGEPAHLGQFRVVGLQVDCPLRRLRPRPQSGDEVTHGLRGLRAVDQERLACDEASCRLPPIPSVAR